MLKVSIRTNFKTNFGSNKTMYKRNVFALFFVGLFVIFSSVAVFAQEDTMKKDKMMMKEDSRPIVAVIKADWCPYCKRVDPVVSGLMGEYSEKLNFVVFDVTDDAKIAESMKKADELGLKDFFEDFKEKTSTVAVLVDKKIVYKTANNSKRDDYVKAFDKALK
jgi:thiol-disulfide isomerase/thioredoxin